jgi:hypothetical protein
VKYECHWVNAQIWNLREGSKSLELNQQKREVKRNEEWTPMRGIPQDERSSSLGRTRPREAKIKKELFG